MSDYARCIDSQICIADWSAALAAIKRANAKRALTNATDFGREDSNSETGE